MDITAFTTSIPAHEKRGYTDKVMRWSTGCYYPACEVEDPLFRDVIWAANPIIKPMSVEVYWDKTKDKAAYLRATLAEMLKGEMVALTSDGWISLAKKAFVATTAHWIDANWVIHSCLLSCRAKEGRSQAVDHLGELEKDLAKYRLDWKQIVALVTDTEATMNATGRLAMAEAVRVGGRTMHHGYVDHILECTTRLTKLLDIEGAARSGGTKPAAQPSKSISRIIAADGSSEKCPAGVSAEPFAAHLRYSHEVVEYVQDS
jgi:hypothetical protein